MNDALPRCSVPGSTCRLLQFEASGARPVWAVLDGAGARRFTGEVTLHLVPTVRTYFQDGELYFAERDGDPTLAQRLIEFGVVSNDELAAGTVHLGAIAHLGRLFDRVPTIDRDQVELALEVITGELLGEIADHTVTSTSVATYRHHANGVNKWVRKPIVVAQAADTPTTGEVPAVAVDVADLDRSILADYEASIAPVEPVASVELATPPLPVVADAPVADTAVEQQPTPPVLDVADSAGFVIPDAPSYYAPTTAAEPPAAPTSVTFDPPPVAAIETVVADAEERPGTITERIWYRDPVLDPETDPTVAPSFDDIAPAAGAPSEPLVAAEAVAFRPAPVEFDLSSVIDAVARENAGVPVPLDDDAVIDDSVRAAVREALAEIEAATRPRVVDSLSPAAFEVALETGFDGIGSVVRHGASTPPDAAPAYPESGADDVAGDADAHPPAPWLPGRTDQDDLADDTETDTPSEVAMASDSTGPGLRRLIGGIRKP